MGTAQKIFPGAAARNVREAEERTAGHAERDLLDCAQRSILAGSAGAVRTMADSIQTVRGMAEKWADRADIP